MERLGDILRRNVWTTLDGSRPPAGNGANRDPYRPGTAGPPVLPPGEPGGEGGDRCPRCGGIGFHYPELPENHPEYGKAVPCDCTQAALGGQLMERLQRYSNMGPLLDMTFDTLSPLGRSGLQADQAQFSNAVDSARSYAASPQGWFVLTGSSGSGKTHVAAAIANACIQRGVPVFFVVVPDLLDHLRAAFNPQSGDNYSELFDQVRNAPLLILDDLGAQSSTHWAVEKLYQLLNHRYSARLPTVITLGSPLETLDERLRHRLSDPVFAQRWPLEQHQDQLLQYQGPLGLGLLATMTFKSFNLNRSGLKPAQRESLREAHNEALKFAEHPEGWLVLIGPVGCGKTHLAAAVANYQLQQGHPVYFVVVPDLLDHLRSSFAPDSTVTYDVLFDRIKTTPLLVLDDLGAQTTTPWAREKLFQLINYRYNATLPTVITTSVSLAEVPAAVASRICDQAIATLIPIDSPDYRDRSGALASATPEQPAARRQPGVRQRRS